MDFWKEKEEAIRDSQRPRSTGLEISNEETSEQEVYDSLSFAIKTLRKSLKNKNLSQLEKSKIAEQIGLLKSHLSKSLNELTTLENSVAKNQRPGFSKSLLVTDDETLQSLLQIEDLNRLFVFSDE